MNLSHDEQLPGFDIYMIVGDDKFYLFNYNLHWNADKAITKPMRVLPENIHYYLHTNWLILKYYSEINEYITKNIVFPEQWVIK